MTKLRGATQFAACLSLLSLGLGACSSSPPFPIDGDISYSHRLNPDAPHGESLLLHPDGSAHRQRSGSGMHDIDEDVTLSPALTDALYMKAADARFDGLPGNIPCSPSQDFLESYTVNVAVVDASFQTVTHCRTGVPTSLLALLDRFGCVVSEAVDGGMEDGCLSK